MIRTSSLPRRLLLLIPLAALFLLFGWVGGPANPYEVAMVERLAAWRHAFPALARMVAAWTWLGSAYVTLGGSAVVGTVLAWRERRSAALTLVTLVFGERFLANGLKAIYDRPRPALGLPQLIHSPSYPSGHAANSMTAFVAVALLVVPPRQRPVALPLAILLAATVGLSRPFLGVHWPTDMFGGWTLAAMVLIALGAVAPYALEADKAQHEVVGGHRPPRIEG